MSEKKKIKCRWCGEIFDEADLIIEKEVVPNQPEPIGWGQGIPRWEEYKIEKCPKCKSIMRYIGIGINDILKIQEENKK